MANPNAVPPRTALSEVRRQIAFNETMIVRVEEDAKRKTAKKQDAYRAKNEGLRKIEAELAALEDKVNRY